MYPTVELKAANLLYLVVKDHPLTDGNKRSAAALFVTFLARNEVLDNADGQPKFTNNALAALTLMVAMSDPTEKDLMVALITKMLAAD
jgi:prophage maintenance system killer protein